MSYRPPRHHLRSSSEAPVGAKLWFDKEKQGYTIRARNERFAVCTKPFNVRRTVLYSVVDFEEGVRGTENLIFGCGAETDEQCREMLERIASGQTEISHRNRVSLCVPKYWTPIGASA